MNLIPKLRNFKLLLRAIKSLSAISDNLQSLNETLIAQTILVNQKPITLTTLDSIDPAKVKSPLLRDLLLSRTQFMSSIPEIVTPKDSDLSADDEEWNQIHRAWRDWQPSIQGNNGE